MVILAVLKNICGKQLYFKNIIGNPLHYLTIGERDWEKYYMYTPNLSEQSLCISLYDFLRKEVAI